MRLGHVAVVSQVLTDRVVQITHANWSRIGGARGQIERDVTVIDVSPAGDWSRVKVWYDPVRDIGSSTYPTYGFIYPDAQAVRMASNRSTPPRARPSPSPRARPARSPRRFARALRRFPSSARPPTPATGSPPSSRP